MAERHGPQLEAERVPAAKTEQHVGLAADGRPDQFAECRPLGEGGPGSPVRGLEPLLLCRRRGLARLAGEPGIEAAERGRHTCRRGQHQQRRREHEHERTAPDLRTGTDHHVQPVGLAPRLGEERIERARERQVDVAHSGTSSRVRRSDACAAFRVAPTVPGLMPRASPIAR